MSTATIAPTGTWNVDPTHSRVGFSVKHLGIATVRGTFKEFEGTLEIGDDLTTAKAYGTVKTASVDTNDAGRDEHLRTADFFDVENYPEITFESTSIEAIDEDSLKIIGNLTIKDVTSEIELARRDRRHGGRPVGQRPRRPRGRRQDLARRLRDQVQHGARQRQRRRRRQGHAEPRRLGGQGRVSHTAARSARRRRLLPPPAR